MKPNYSTGLLTTIKNAIEIVTDELTSDNTTDDELDRLTRLQLQLVRVYRDTRELGFVN